MGSEILVGIGEFRVAKGAVLKTIGLGSCVGIALYDPKLKLGGLAHVMLPQSNNGTKRSANYADQAIEMMTEAMERLGSDRKRIVAKMAGGAQIFKHMTMDMLRIGDRNAEAIRTILRDYGIRIVSEDLGGDEGRTVYFFTNDGRMLVKYSRGGELWI
ncbi:Chemotaxis protein, stimulates methylation of MCP protein [Archaeoglobus fulgidus DSM 8774]|uniref:Probable chemoreceptor glutamine deamidase CheD n=1 Tax=Archaeoglobus fulgidus DSM 8774 TaxID=1344584 RepID=A0A075WDZ4_ARCFL|nr:chemotaxis protein CheD [Archaeoglobus fulgidus]AIG97917.1 Chemotaxis protein, stimulates methylation of MCP protein [Archaeoglobus fulgidus DSM 8774]